MKGPCECSTSCWCCVDGRWRPTDAALLQDTWAQTAGIGQSRGGVCARVALPPATGVTRRRREQSRHEEVRRWGDEDMRR